MKFALFLDKWLTPYVPLIVIKILVVLWFTFWIAAIVGAAWSIITLDITAMWGKLVRSVFVVVGLLIFLGIWKD